MTDPKGTVIVADFKFLRCSVYGKRLMLFLSETSVFKFLRRGVDEAFKIHLNSYIFCYLYIVMFARSPTINTR